jgi:hypothetical protein
MSLVAVPPDEPALARRFEELLAVLRARDEASDRAASEGAQVEGDGSDVRLEALLVDEALATFVGDLLVAHGRSMRVPGAPDTASVRYDPRLFVLLLGALTRASTPAAMTALERCIDELVEDKEHLMLANLLHAPRDAVRARVAEHFRSFRGSAAMVWAEELGLGLPAEWDWQVELRVGTVSKLDRKARHKRATPYELRCVIHHPPFFLRHAVKPLIIAWSIDLTGPEPWSGSWLDSEPERPLVDASQRMRPVKHLVTASLARFPELVATVGERMGTRFYLEETKISVRVGYPAVAAFPRPAKVEEKLRAWLVPTSAP